jgi:glycosyltransferase involved in cell wall biosynthesis
MRILLMPNTFAPVLGGLQTATHNLAKHLLQNVHQVQVVTNRYPRSLPAHEMLDGIPIHRLLLLSPDFDSLRRRRPDLFVASWYFYPHSSWQLRNLMRRFRPRVVNVHFPDHQIRFVLGLRQQFEFRLVVSLHGHDVEKLGNDSVATKPLQSILREADAVTACSQHLLDGAIRVEPSITDKARVIHNGVDPDRFADKSFHFHRRPYVFAFGRLTHKKGFDMLLEAFAQAEGAAEETDLIIAGDGEEWDALCLQAQRLGLTGRVHFRGRATPEEVVRLLNGCLFVVVPSRSEPFGIVALEALAAGKPLLATTTGGLVEFLTEFSDGKMQSEQSDNLLFGSAPVVTLVDPRVDELATGLRRMFELVFNDSREMSDYQIADKYSWAHVTRCYESVLVG